MAYSVHPILRVLQQDPRYPIEAYEFVRESLAYAQDVLGMGREAGASPLGESESESEEEDEPLERHLTGQQLCHASLEYALKQYGLMAKVVLASWGIRATSDLGEIVYNLIRVDLMKKSDADRREDFDDVFDFERAFDESFQFTASD